MRSGVESEGTPRDKRCGGTTNSRRLVAVAIARHGPDDSGVCLSSTRAARSPQPMRTVAGETARPSLARSGKAGLARPVRLHHKLNAGRVSVVQAGESRREVRPPEIARPLRPQSPGRLPETNDNYTLPSLNLRVQNCTPGTWRGGCAFVSNCLFGQSRRVA